MSGFRLVDVAVKSEPGDKSLRVTLRAAKLPLIVDVVYRVYDGPAIRKALVLHNTGHKRFASPT